MNHHLPIVGYSGEKPRRRVGTFLLLVNTVAALLLAAMGILVGGAIAFEFYQLWWVEKVFWDNQLLFPMTIAALLETACLPVAIHLLVGVRKELKRRQYWTE